MFQAHNQQYTHHMTNQMRKFETDNAPITQGGKHTPRTMIKKITLRKMNCNNSTRCKSE